ncbi:glycosyltransferase [Geomonas nitrogeniifigens]|uniref:Glycosyltransferase n=1 Tax=Geomonas diazotrophica TaxID=2843197 RepID=A0ABX8JK69_9BACT|nr:glycosyltransferase [Geomonas nitrogeniifigens]QWV97029.1 glycosyltransferase [Geomonas nitrogeniifigens]
MRIMIGVTEIGGNIPVVAGALRQLGHQVTTVVRQKNSWWPIEYDVDFSGRDMTIEDVLDIGYLVGTHDVFIFQWARTSLLPNHADYPFIKKAGKKIISCFVGSDVRDTGAYKQWYVDGRRFLEKLPFPEDPVVNPLFSMRMAELHSEIILSQPNQSVLGVRPYHHFFLPMELSLYRQHIPAREVPVVVHAPSKSWLKGTDVIMAALETLKQQGVRYELRFLEGLPNDVVIKELINADVLIDELYFPLHGKLSLEGLACGCAVVNGDREDYEPFPAERPFWYVNPDNIVERLRQLLTDRDLRIRLALEGGPYMKMHHDHVRVMQRVMDKLEQGENCRCDHYPTFFTGGYRLPDGEAIPAELVGATTQLVRRWGLPEGVNLAETVARGLLSPDILKNEQAIPRWSRTQSGGHIFDKTSPVELDLQPEHLREARQI